MDDIRKWYYETRTAETAKNLIRHGFDVLELSDRATACDELLKRILPTKTVGVGGSVTIREIGIIERLKEQGNTVYDHWEEGLDREDSMNVRKAQLTCDLFLSSSNAVTMTGEIVNMDGFCNRTSSMAFGPGEVILVVGRNKIVRDVPAALARIREIAGPMNARRFGADTPCVKMGRCTDCDSPQRICRGTLILEREPFTTNILIIIVQEDLGY